MSPGRLNALTDGVVAIVLTIMVLELKFPEEPTLAAALSVLPLLAAYVLAFIYVAIYWNNHHHMMQSAHKVTGVVLWSIPMGLIAAADPAMAKGIADGMTAYLRGIPEELYALFGTGYLGYTAARTWGKVKGVER